MGKRLWAIGKEVDARQGISSMTEKRLGVLGFELKKSGEGKIFDNVS